MYILASKCASRHSGIHFFDIATLEKHSVSRLSYLFAHLHLLSSHSFSSTLLSSNLSLLSASSLLCFSSVHIAGIYTKMLWGKGLNNIVQYIPEALDDIESTNRVHGRPVLPVLVIVGWAGNDVFGEGGYRGVHWIHRASYNKSAADREDF